MDQTSSSPRAWSPTRSKPNASFPFPSKNACFQDTLLRLCSPVQYTPSFYYCATFTKQGLSTLGFLLAEMTWLAPFQGTYTSVVVARECLGSCVSCIMATNEERNEALAIKTTTTTSTRRSRAFFTRGDSFQRFSAAVASAAASVSHSFNHPTTAHSVRISPIFLWFLFLRKTAKKYYFEFRALFCLDFMLFAIVGKIEFSRAYFCNLTNFEFSPSKQL